MCWPQHPSQPWGTYLGTREGRGGQGRGRGRSLGCPWVGGHVPVQTCPYFNIGLVHALPNPLIWGLENKLSISLSTYGEFWRGTCSLVELSCPQDLFKATVLLTFPMTGLVLTPLPGYFLPLIVKPRLEYDLGNWWEVAT